MNIIDMRGVIGSEPDISVSVSSAETLHEIYREVRSIAVAVASCEEDLLLDMGENEEGMPEADFFDREGRVVRKIFAEI